jgi:FkbM family methyltransferase
MLRSGVSRRVVAHHLVNSEEARQSGRRYSGLSELLVTADKTRRRGGSAVVSVWSKNLDRFRNLYRLAARVPLLERIDNKLNVLLSELEKRLDLLSSKTDESLWTISAKLDDYVVDLKSRQAALQQELSTVAIRQAEIDATLLKRLDGASEEAKRAQSEVLQASVGAASSLARVEQEFRGLSRLVRSELELVTHAVDRLTMISAEASNATGGRLDTLESHWAAMQGRLSEYGQQIERAAESVDQKIEGTQAEMLGRLRAIDSWLERVAYAQRESETARSIAETRLAAELSAVNSRARPLVIQAGDVVATEVDGFIVGLPAQEWRLVAYHVFRGVLEPGLLHLFRSLVRPGMAVIDVGANVGIFTLHAARLLEGQGSIFSFEPAPRTFRILEDNIQVNGFKESGIVHLRRQAVSDYAGTSRLAIYPRDCGHNTLFPDGPPEESVDVDVVALDDALAGAGNIDVVKIDAEGAEPLILRGMQRMITQNPGIRIFLEFAPSHLARAGVKPEEFLAELRSYGLNLALVDESTGALRSTSDEGFAARFTSNLVASPAPLDLGWAE